MPLTLERVQLQDGVVCEVDQMLSVQMTVKTPDGKIVWLFYRDKNDTWKPYEEKDDE